MNITGVEVIHNTSPAIGVVAGEKIELTYGNTLRINVSFDYRGLAGSATLYGAIGNRKWAYPFPDVRWFDEILHNEVAIDLPESLTEFTPCERSVDIGITSDIDPGTDYDLYVKMKEYPEADMPEVDNVIDIIGVPPSFELIQHTIYPFAYIYDGDVELTTATFKTAAFAPSDWMADKFASKLEEEIRQKGSRPIEVKVYVDKTPLLWTDFKVEVTGTPIVQGVGVAVGIPIWAAILIAALAIIAVIVVATLAAETISKLFHPKPGLKDVKPGWGKETLIQTINDSEEYWERTPTPPEELEGMSEAELRDHLDQMAEEEAPGITWWPIAVGAGVAALGIGIAATRKRK